MIALTGDADVEFITGVAHSTMLHLQLGQGEQRMEWVVRTQSATVTVTVTSERGINCSGTLRLAEIE